MQCAHTLHETYLPELLPETVELAEPVDELAAPVQLVDAVDPGLVVVAPPVHERQAV